MIQNKKLRTVSATLIGIVLFSLILSCTRQINQPESAKVTAKELYPLKVTYIGDNSKVGTLLNALHLNYESFEIQSKEVPYGLTVYLPKSKWKKGEKTPLEKEAALLLGLIENASFVTFTDKNREYGQYYDVEGITKEIGYSPKVFFQQEEKLDEFLKKDSQL